MCKVKFELPFCHFHFRCRHLTGQLQEMVGLIQKMIQAEFLQAAVQLQVGCFLLIYLCMYLFIYLFSSVGFLFFGFFFLNLKF